VFTEESISPGLTEPPDVQLDVSPLDPDQRVQPVGLAPLEPLPQLEGVEGMGAPGAAGQVRHGPPAARSTSMTAGTATTLGFDMGSPLAGDVAVCPATLAADATRHSMNRT
jgi:hypothetical protein